ncbi:MAG: hypothetical protein FJ078_04270 [Cyanobacteria bacterium K_DeepCast_35m_m2_155]|nr:hypothetical protein [Cyanobacteria bacterium K_DeepCast_35m_m2_155]
MDELLSTGPVDDDATDALRALVAQAADLCLKPLRHAVRLEGEPLTTLADCSDCLLRIDARDAEGARQPAADLELEIYRSSGELNLMLSSPGNEHAPVLWHGSHPVWMHPDTGLRCDRPAGGAALEALCRRLRAGLSPDR